MVKLNKNIKFTEDELAKWQKEKTTRLALQNEGFLSAVLGSHPPWVMSIWEQPCFVMPSTVAEGNTYDPSRESSYDPQKSVSTSHRLLSSEKEVDWLTSALLRTGGKARGPAGQVLGGFMREVIGIFVFNPWLHWKQLDEKNKLQDKWRSTMRTVEGEHSFGNTVLYNPLTKLVFCVVKVFGSPLILVYFALRFFYVFLISLKIPEFGKQIFFSLLSPIIYLFGRQRIFDHIKYRELPDGSLEPSKENSFPFLTAIHFYLGMIIPFQLTGSKALGESYGKGGISILILVFMIISAGIIIIGGLNMVVITLVFFAYMYKTIDSLKTSAMGSGGQGGN